MDTVQKFRELVTHRSEQNRKSVEILHAQGLHENVMAILRQEIDSFVRVIYVLSCYDYDYATKLLDDCLEGRRWTKENSKILTDREMVDRTALTSGGWEGVAYKFGCSFIHLSNLCDLRNVDIEKVLTSIERANIADYINQYHFYDKEIKFPTSFTIDDIAHIAPAIFIKIHDNIKRSLGELDNHFDELLEIKRIDEEDV